MLKVSPWKGVIRFDKREKLNPYYIRPFEILAKVGIVAYRLELLEQLSRVNSTLHVSNLKRCLSNKTLVIPLDEIQIEDKLHFIEELFEIMDREGLEYGPYGVSKDFDTAYWEFLRVGTMFDIFQNIYILYLEYDVLTSPRYGLLIFIHSWSFMKCRQGYTGNKVDLDTMSMDDLYNNLEKSELMALGYTIVLELMEEKLRFYKTYESIYLQDIKGLKFEIQIGEITIRDLRKKLEIVQKEKDGIQLNVDKFKHASKSLNKLIERQMVDNCKKGLGYENYNAIPPPYTRNFMPLTPDLSFNGLDEFVNKPVVENCEAMSSEDELKVVRKYDDASSIEEWVLDDEE
uniref:Putative reverse transcriptase domain-containing protein n=1 Tax=Tanacetum cinerariifolium TaxID=118510 RepID=A0A6L2JYB5_TANCI|nr:putative reverse transcriptase domain-containing protein [Tanacetum cinerariifolium]